MTEGDGDRDGDPASSTLSATTPPGPAAPADLPRGAALGRYIVIERLGGGGMGVVYAAYDPELDRKVAVKLLRPEAVTDQSRLRREAQAMARLQHPNVIAVYDVGVFSDRNFVAMELVDGTTLTRWLEERTRSWREIVALFAQAGRGLAAAHAVGLVHRDFKLANVLVGRDGRVRVVDFGLARSVAASDELGAAAEREAAPLPTLDETITRTGALLGTPTYISPEQFAGHAADARSDQFSFCVALYRALWGERPFAGDELRQIADEVTHGRLRMPSNDGRVPAWVRDVVLRGLATAPAQRWPSMEELLAALSRDPATARRRVGLAAGAVIGVGALLVGVRAVEHRGAAVCRGAERQLAGVWDAQRRNAVHAAFGAIAKPYREDAFTGVARALDAYAQSWAAMHTDACEATRLRGEQSEQLLDLRMECLAQRRQDMRAAVDLLAHADEQIVEKSVQLASGLGSLEPCANAAALLAPVHPPADAATRAKVDDLRRRLGAIKALAEAGKYRESLPRAQQAVAEARALGYAPLLAEALFWLGRLEWQDAKDREAEERFAEAAAAAVAGRDERMAARMWIELARSIGGHASQLDDAQRWERLASAAVARVGDDELRGDLCRARALIFFTRRDNEQALAEDQRALAFYERALGPEHPKVATTHAAIAADFAEQGRADEALASYRRALALDEKALGPHHPDLALPLIDIGLMLGDRGDFAEAVVNIRRALAIRLKTLGPDHPDVAFALARLAEPLERAGLYDEAMANGRQALAIYEKAVGKESEEVAFTLNRIGEILLDQRRFAEALTQYRRALAVFEKTVGPEAVNTAYALTGVGRSAIGLHDARGAIAPLERALRLRERQPGEPFLVAETRFALARALVASGGDRTRARTLAQKARDGYAAAGAGYGKELGEIDAWLLGARE